MATFPHLEVIELLGNGDTIAAERLVVESGAGIRGLSDGGLSLLALATFAHPSGRRTSRPESAATLDLFIRQLLGRGADPNLAAKDRSPAVYIGATRAPQILELLLEAGGDPTVNIDGRGTAIRHAMAQRLDENVLLLRKYAKPFLAKMKGASVVAKRSKRKVDPAAARHARELRRLFRDEPRWEILATKAAVANVLERLGQSSLEADPMAHKKLVPEEKEQLFVLRLKGMSWTLCIKRLGYYGADGRKWLRKTAAEWSRSLGETLAFWGLQMFRYEAGAIVEERSWSIDDVDDDDLDEDEGLVDATEANLFSQMDAWMKEKDLLLPAMEDVSDGYCRRLAVVGVKKSDVEQMAIVDLAKYQ